MKLTLLALLLAPYLAHADPVAGQAVAPPAPTVQPDEQQRQLALIAANLDARAISEERCAPPLLWVGGIAALAGGCGVAVSLGLIWANPILGGGCLVGSLCVTAVGLGVASTGLQYQKKAASLRNDAAVLHAMNY